MHKLVLLLTLGACAAGNLARDRDTAPRARAHLDLASAEPTLRITPSPIDPQMPTVDRLANRLRGEIGDATSTDLAVCVRPSGKVASVELVGGSAMPELDLAIVKDASAWQFTAMPGPETVQSCRTVTVAYRSHK